MLWGLLHRYSRLILWTALVACFLNALSLVVPLSFMAVIDRVLISEGYASLQVILVILCITAAVELALRVGQFRISQWVGLGMEAESAGVFYRHLFQLKQSYFDRTPIGEIISRTGELDKLRTILIGWIMTVLVDLLFMLVFLLVMLSFSGLLTALVLATVPLHLGQYFVFGSSLKRCERDNFQAGIEHQSAVVETLQGMNTIRACGKAESGLAQVFGTLDATLRTNYRLAQVGLWSSQTSTLVSKLSEASILFMGATLVLDQSMTLGALVAFNMMKDRVTGPLIRLASIWEEVLAFKLSLERLNTVFDYPSDRRSDTDVKVIACHSVETLEVDGLSYAYDPDGEPVLSGVHLCLAQGERLCLLGESGAGKSTLTKLLSLMYDDYTGELRINGIDICEYDIDSLRGQIAYVLQKNVLFSGTIASNILYASDRDDDVWMRRAAKLACADGFIESLPLGYATPVTEGGKNLSGGQVQRIALARAFASSASLIVLDEATSALDYETEARVVANLEQLDPDVSLIIVTHRLSLARASDRIVVLKNGRVVEVGTHSELIEQPSAYRELHQYQVGNVVPLVPGLAQ